MSNAGIIRHYVRNLAAVLKDVLAVMTFQKRLVGLTLKANVYTSSGTSQSKNTPPLPSLLLVFKTARQVAARGLYTKLIVSMRGNKTRARGALSSLVWALEACKGMMQSRSGAVHLKATIHHCTDTPGAQQLDTSLHAVPSICPSISLSLSIHFFVPPINPSPFLFILVPRIRHTVSISHIRSFFPRLFLISVPRFFLSRLLVEE